MADATLDLLLVDDEPDMVRGLRRILRSRGHRVDVAHSGAEAITMSKEVQPDGVLMDICMPGMNGVEAFRHIRRRCPISFVIFMTAYSELAEEARSEGSTEVLSKPREVDQLCLFLELTANNRPILIVDDDPDFCRSLELNLRDRSLDVRLASTDADAILAFEKSPRALVLLGMNLPDQSGLEVLRQLKELNKDALVVEMSGVLEMHKAMREGIELSASSYLTKPFEMSELFAHLDAASTQRKPR